jgi:hypothetical protein
MMPAETRIKTPFWANNHSEMYMNVLHDELRFPEDSALDRDTKSFIRGVSTMYPWLIFRSHAYGQPFNSSCARILNSDSKSLVCDHENVP